MKSNPIDNSITMTPEELSKLIDDSVKRALYEYEKQKKDEHPINKIKTSASQAVNTAEEYWQNWIKKMDNKIGELEKRGSEWIEKATNDFARSFEVMKVSSLRMAEQGVQNLADFYTFCKGAVKEATSPLLRFLEKAWNKSKELLADVKQAAVNDWRDTKEDFAKMKETTKVAAIKGWNEVKDTVADKKAEIEAHVGVMGDKATRALDAAKYSVKDFIKLYKLEVENRKRDLTQNKKSKNTPTKQEEEVDSFRM